MKTNHIQNLIISLYVNKKNLTLNKANKYIKIIKLKVQEQKIDYALAYSLILKVFELVEPLKAHKSKNVK